MGTAPDGFVSAARVGKTAFLTFNYGSFYCLKTSRSQGFQNTSTPGRLSKRDTRCQMKSQKRTGIRKALSMKQHLFFGAAVGITLAAMTLFLAEPSRAEGRCPDGYFPIGGGSAGWEGCAPMGGGRDEDPGPQQETRWGAIATGKGAFGAVENAVSKKSAERIAMQRCRASTPGAQCKIKGSYHDQCVALAWGDGGALAFRSPDLADAERMAVANCSKYTTDCQLYYSACSLPVQSQ